MRKQFCKALTTAVVLSAVATFAQATTITFAPLTSVNQGFAGDGTTYLEGGMTFTSSVSDPSALFHWGTSQGFNADPTGATLFQNYSGRSVVVTQTGGGSFYLASIDLADVYNNGSASVIPFSYTDGGGTHNSNLVLDNLVGLQTFSLNLAGVTSFSLQQEFPYFQVDNIVVNPSAPEPASLALLGLGLAGLGFSRRRKS